MKSIGLYIHIPFCKQKCFYCDFCSYANKLELQDRYVNSVINELKNIDEDYLINTIYIGGGTPSIIEPGLIGKILEAVNSKFQISEDVEITIEVNPGTISLEKANMYKSFGINRVSMGLQSANDELLKIIGRIHNYNDFENAYSILEQAHFDNINVDLMIGLPNQTMLDTESTLQKIILKNPKHISVYSLIVEPGTVMEKLIDEKKLTLPDEDVERAMYWTVKNILESNGFYQYEISNFAKKGFESRHNMDCWNQKEYIGLGAAAHSYLNAIRYSNISSVEKYIANIENNNFESNKIIHETQNNEDMMKEYMIIGLRKISGVDINAFKKKFNSNPIEVFKNEIDKMIKLNLVKIKDNSISLTSKGIDFANVVWEEFV
mgnify:CR=1 FL=1